MSLLRKFVDSLNISLYNNILSDVFLAYYDYEFFFNFYKVYASNQTWKN